MAIIDNLVSYWKLDEASGVIADAHGSTTGTLTGATYGATGKINDAISFDGTGDTINFGDVFDTELTTGAWSISGWVNLTSNASASIRGIWSKSNGASSGGGIMVYQGGGSAGRNQILVSLLDGSVPSPKFITTATITTGSYVYLTVTWDGTTSTDSIKVYFDGVKQARTESDYGTSPQSNALDFVFSGGTGTELLLIGVMDEVGLWDKELIQSEITSLYNSGSGFAYPFSEGTNMKININDDFKDVDSMKINIGDVWKDVAEVTQNIGDAWKTVF